MNISARITHKERQHTICLKTNDMSTTPRVLSLRDCNLATVQGLSIAAEATLH
jgi:hypothetical protein